MAELRPRLLLLVAALVAAPVLAHGQAPRGAPPPGAPPPVAPPPGGGRAALASGTPTELLFDAIAIGNSEVVREAVGRGANLNARNVLGQRPVDLAIDVGRSDIAFLLLSLMRAGQPERAAPAPSPSDAQGPRPERARPAPVQLAPPAPPRFATRWANDGGAPQPDIGFLGFDASRPETARPPAGARPGR
jgi:hypothetical protein